MKLSEIRNNIKRLRSEELPVTDRLMLEMIDSLAKKMQELIDLITDDGK